jgi:hypothetical protein
MYVEGAGLNSQYPPDINGDNGVVGYNNLVTTSNVSADYALASNPVTNLANPSTALKWKSGATGAQNVTVLLSGSSPVDYLAVAGGNFGSGVVPVKAQGWLGDYVLGSNRALTTETIPILSEAKYPLLTEAGGIIVAETTGYPVIGDISTNPTNAYDGTTSQAAASCSQKAAATTGYTGKDFTKSAAGFRIFKATVYGSNDQGYVSTIAPTVTLTLYGKTGTTAPANSTDGTVLGTINFTDLANESAGRDIVSTDQATLYNYAWVKVDNGGAANQLNVAELQIYQSNLNWFDLTTATTPTDDLPTIFRFNRQTALFGIRLNCGASTGQVSAAVLFTGTLMILQRRVYVGHTPLNLSRATSVVTGMSEAGNFLGRILVGESRKTSVTLSNLSPVWYRNNMDPFISAAKTTPFFYAWRPASYPAETGYAWLTGDATPSNQSANGLMQVTLPIGGVAS